MRIMPGSDQFGMLSAALRIFRFSTEGRRAISKPANLAVSQTLTFLRSVAHPSV